MVNSGNMVMIYRSVNHVVGWSQSGLLNYFLLLESGLLNYFLSQQLFKELAEKQVSLLKQLAIEGMSVGIWTALRHFEESFCSSCSSSIDSSHGSDGS